MAELKFKGGDAVYFKDKLTHSEQRAIYVAMSATVPRGEPSSVQAASAMQRALAEAEFALLETFAQVYVTGWTLHDDAGELIPFEPWLLDEPMPATWGRVPDEKSGPMMMKAQRIWKGRQKNAPLAEPDAGETSDNAEPT